MTRSIPSLGWQDKPYKAAHAAFFVCRQATTGMTVLWPSRAAKHASQGIFMDMKLQQARRNIRRMCKTLLWGILTLDALTLFQGFMSDQPWPWKTLLALNVTAVLIIGILVAGVKWRDFVDTQLDNEA